MSRAEPSTRPEIDPRDPYYRASLSPQAAVDHAASRGVRTTRSAVKIATETGKLAYSLVSGKRAYAPADVDAWLLSLRKEVSA